MAVTMRFLLASVVVFAADAKLRGTAASTQEMMAEGTGPTSPRMASSAIGAEPAGMYERKTQAPIVWLNLHKSRFPKRLKNWYGTPYERDALQELAASGPEFSK